MRRKNDKKCPKCGNEFDAELTTRPTCGYSLTDTTVDKEEAETTSTNIDFETQENEQHEDQLNENIEWSELKDMSLYSCDGTVWRITRRRK